MDQNLETFFRVNVHWTTSLIEVDSAGHLVADPMDSESAPKSSEGGLARGWHSYHEHRGHHKAIFYLKLVSSRTRKTAAPHTDHRAAREHPSIHHQDSSANT